MKPSQLSRRLPGSLRRHVLFFEEEIERAVERFSGSLGPGSRVLDAGAGEGQYAGWFRGRQLYTAVDLAVGDPQWDYSRLDCMADLVRLPFADNTFDACLNIVTLEHVPEPGAVLGEIARVLKPGGLLLLVVPHEWEVHQAPHDYFRYTRYGISYLLGRAGLTGCEIEPVGGYFRLLARRLLNGLQFFMGGLRWFGFAPAALLLVPPALLLPLADPLDRDRNFTLGYICKASKPS